PGLYTVSLYAVDSNTCRDSASHSIIVRSTVFIPNTFTPNGDAINDVFKPDGVIEPIEYLMVIYNRWGEEVFSTIHYEIPWDGRVQGQEVDAPADVYVYHIRITDKNGENFEFRGWVFLLR
ncbi:MAG: gliding motility-associated C-terminal domain-containing protein, partial [Bacteroidetes bacterium]|nr:gliding motility-associated C-terminal domain-containing protein [Bacteroidota bacterium]